MFDLFFCPRGAIAFACVQIEQLRSVIGDTTSLPEPNGCRWESIGEDCVQIEPDAPPRLPTLTLPPPLTLPGQATRGERSPRHAESMS